MNQLKNITEDYGKILTALQHAVVECDQKMEAYEEKNRFFEDWAIERAHRLAGAQTRSAEHRTRIEQNQGVIHRTPAPPPPLTNTAPLQPFEPPVGGGALEWRGGGDKGSRVGEERGGGGHYSARLRKFEQMCPFDQHAAYHALEDRFTILSCFLSGISRGYHCVDVFLDFERCPILPHV